MKSKADRFRFRHFDLDQTGAAHRLGIDTVALGCWVYFGASRQVVDCGTGTGVLALLAAQRSTAQVTALEIQPESAACARRNIEASPWSGRVQVLNIDWNSFNPGEVVDHVICNPPYFRNQYTSENTSRMTARQEHGSPASFLKLVDGWGGHDLRCSMIFPLARRDEWMQAALVQGWFRQREALLTEGRALTDRVLVTWGKHAITGVNTEEISVWQSSGEYHPDFRALTQEAYWKL